MHDYKMDDFHSVPVSCEGELELHNASLCESYNTVERSRSLAGLSVLIIEDEYVVVLMMEDLLAGAGCHLAGVANTIEDALEKISSVKFDIAILDVNLNGRHATTVAEMLRAMSMPFVVTTGYSSGGLPSMFQDVPVVTKPFQQSDFESGLLAALDMKF